MQRLSAIIVSIALVCNSACSANPSIADPSFEQPKSQDRQGRVFEHWDGWKYEGECEFRVSNVAHSGNHSCLLFGGDKPKIRVYVTHKSLKSGRYKITAYLRGLDIGVGQWNYSTEFAFNGKYFQLYKNGTFGWTKLTYVTEVAESSDVMGPSFGLLAPGYLWIDDVSMEKVGDDVPLTQKPILSNEETPITPPGKLSNRVLHCPECSYRNSQDWKACYACGSKLDTPIHDNGKVEAIKVLAAFENKSPFGNGRIVKEHATVGKRAWRLDKGYTDWTGNQDWTGYDYLKADLHTDATEPVEVYVEVRDKLTRDYWSRVNFNTVIPPGSSTLVIPIDQLYVGEKARPGRKLMSADITRLVFSIGENPSAPLFLDNLRLEKDVETHRMLFDGLHAFDLGPANSPLMPGFRRLSPSVVYSEGRGFGLKNAKIWRAYDVRQPEPLYQDFICFERGGIAIDVPNGRYHVMINLDNPSGYWGEYQNFRERQIVVERYRQVVWETMNFVKLRDKYFRSWNLEDLPTDNTFDKYQEPYYDEKQFEVDVKDGQLNIEFAGADWACSVSAIVVYPESRKKEGQAFLDYAREQRRFFFDQYFKRVLHTSTGDAIRPTATDRARGYLTFARDYMEDVYYNDTPRRDEIDKPVEGFAFAGEYEPLTLSVLPLKELGKVTVCISDLEGPSGAVIPASNISVGFVSNRIARETMEGSIYTIEPRLIMPWQVVDMPKGIARRFWLTVRVPYDAIPGVYQGQISIALENGELETVPVKFRVFKGTLDAVDIPVGPWGHGIGIPWYSDDLATQKWNYDITRKSLKLLRDYGFTSFSGMPQLEYRGFSNGQPQFDFSHADAQMKMARELGFHMPIVNYCHFGGIDLYQRDEAAMRAAGFTVYSKFIKAVFSAIQRHADRNNWLPVYWNIGDEPIGDALDRAAENANDYRKAFPKGPPFFTAATSFVSGKSNDGHFKFGKALHVANLNGHNEKTIQMLRNANSNWGFYNGGNRWTFGTYMYKAVKQYNMKFRHSWHWNAVAGDPYYALDCREDDYTWCNASPDGTLIHSVRFDGELREGLDDYRYMLTLSRLASEKKSRTAEAMIKQRLESFELGQRHHNALFPVSDWREFRRKMAVAIENLRNGK